jgi:hypothetical protein
MSRSRLPWVITAVAAAAIVIVLAATGSLGGARHPAPRAGITGAGVLPASTFGDDERLVETYTAAREMPAVLDGLYCYCQCKENFGHRSLLTCFQSEHAASCDICLTEAEMAAAMHRRGDSLDAIRRAIDARFRS